MGCACQNKGPKLVKSYTVTSPDGTKKSYKTEVEASAAAKRVGGTWKPA